MSDPDLIELAMQLTKSAEASSETTASVLITGNAPDPSEQPIQPPSMASSPGLTLAVPTKEIKSSDELAAMITADLGKIEGCPQLGVKVVVYGSNPWNSWLSFGAEGGPVRNKADLQSFCNIITERLKRLYDITN